MGLDIYFTKVPKENAINNFQFKPCEKCQEIYSWRNCYDLQYWLSDNYYSSGGDGLYDHTYLFLSSEDIDELENNMKHSTRYFKNYINNFEKCFFYENEEDLDPELLNINTPRSEYTPRFFKRVREAIEEGYVIYAYSSW